MTAMMLVLVMVLSTLSGSVIFAAEDAERGIENVVVYTTVKPAGQFPDKIEVTVIDGTDL